MADSSDDFETSRALQLSSHPVVYGPKQLPILFCVYVCVCVFFFFFFFLGGGVLVKNIVLRVSKPYSTS